MKSKEGENERKRTCVKEDRIVITGKGRNEGRGKCKERKCKKRQRGGFEDRR